MKRITSCLILLVFGVVSSYSQKAKIIDLTDLQPIADVFIYCGTKSSSVSDEDGYVDLTGFSATELIMFTHRSYKPKAMTLRQVENAGWIVKMEENMVRVNEVVVSANRWEQNRAEIPNRITYNHNTLCLQDYPIHHTHWLSEG